MDKSVDNNRSNLPDQSGKDVASLLLKMQRQLIFLEKKIDNLISQLQEKPYRESSHFDKPYRKKSFSKASPTSRHSRSYSNEKQKESSDDKGSDQAFYSKYRKTNGPSGSGSQKKPFHHKQKKRERPFSHNTKRS